MRETTFFAFSIIYFFFYQRTIKQQKHFHDLVVFKSTRAFNFGVDKWQVKKVDIKWENERHNDSILHTKRSQTLKSYPPLTKLWLTQSCYGFSKGYLTSPPPRSFSSVNKTPTKSHTTLFATKLALSFLIAILTNNLRFNFP